MPQQAQGGKLTFGFRPTLRVFMIKKREEFVQRTIALLFRQRK